MCGNKKGEFTVEGWSDKQFHSQCFSPPRRARPTPCRRKGLETKLVREGLIFVLVFPGMAPVSPGVQPVSVPYNPTRPITGGAPSLYIPGVQSRRQSNSTPSSTTSTPTFCTASGAQFTNLSRSEAQRSPSIASPPSPNLFVPITRDESEFPDQLDEGPNRSDEQREDQRVSPHVDFTEFFRQVEELGEDVVYGWDRTVAGETSA